MKKYEKKYEDFYNSEKVFKRCNIDKVKASDFDLIEKYQRTLKSNIKSFQLHTFDSLIKIVWLFRRFNYGNVKRKRMNANGIVMDSAFSVFMRNFIGYDNKLITRNKTNAAIISYFDSFFPDFDESDPFKNKYEYPYEYMNFECLVSVHKMSERMELLKEGEKNKMSYTDFVDYVINYAMSYNEEHGDTYMLSHKNNYFLYITINKVWKN